MSDIEKRSYLGEVRAEKREDEPTHIIGYGSVFNSKSEVMWGFREIIMPGAFDDCLNDDVRGLFNHDPNFILGRCTAGTLSLAFNDNTFRLLQEMEDAQKRPIWLPDIRGVAPATILGHQYVIDQGIKDIGTGNKFIYLGDFNRFIVRRVSYMTLKRLVERYAEFDQVGFLAFHRFDCVLEDTSAIKALVGK